MPIVHANGIDICFEETFTLCPDETERQAFIKGLCTAPGGADSRVSVALGVRADFYGHCAEYPDLVEAMRDRQVTVGPMSRAELREAMIGPATSAASHHRWRRP